LDCFNCLQGSYLRFPKSVSQGKMWSAQLFAVLLWLAILRPAKQSPLTNPLKEGGDISQVIPSYLVSGSNARKAYYNETPAIHLGAADVQKKRHFETGKHESCSEVDFRIKWSSSVSSSVYSTPLIFQSSDGGKKHILVSTFYQTLEMLESTGFKPWGWPITFEGSTFQGTPVLFDVDGDGVEEIGVVDKSANVYFVRMGEYGQYLEDFHMQVPSLRVKRDWHVGLDAEFMDYNSMMSMFDRKEAGYKHSGDRAKASAETAAAEDKGGAAAGVKIVRPKVVKPDDLSLSKPPPRGGASSEHVARMPRKVGSSLNTFAPKPAEDQHGRRLLETTDSTDDAHSFRGAANHHGIAQEGKEEGGLGADAAASGGGGGAGGDGGSGSPADPFDGRTDDFRRDFYYGRGPGRRPVQSFDDGYHYYMSGYINQSAYINIDPHVLGSPVVVDINNDGRMELIMAVSYYFDKSEHAAVRAREGGDIDPDNYIAGGIACWDLNSQRWSWTVHLDLTTDKTRFKALIYASPTVADIDGDGRSEVLIGTSLGLLYVLDGESGFARRHFPMQFHEIQAQIAVADVHGGLHLEIIVADMGGNLVLVDIDGEVLWDAKLSGALPYTPTVGDVDGDGQLDIVVIAMQDTTSHLWVVDGATGMPLLGYPIKLPSNGLFSSSALLVDLFSGAKTKQQGVVERRSGLHIIVPAFDGHVYLIDGVKKCYDRIDVGDHLFSTPLLEDVTGDGQLDLVLGTVNGQVLTIETSIPSHPKNVWSGFPRYRGGNGFTFDQAGIMLKQDLGLQPRKDASSPFQNYTISFEIWDKRKAPPPSASSGGGESLGWHNPNLGLERRYTVTIAPYGSPTNPMFSQSFSEPGVHTVSFGVQPPEHAALVLAMVNDHGQRFEDSFVLQATTSFHQSLKYLSLSVVAGLVGLLSVLA